VALLQFGLSDDDYHFVGYETDMVIHAAAYVNLVYPYAALYGCNVLGTQNVLLFCYANKLKPLHYIRYQGAPIHLYTHSTDAVIPHMERDFAETGDFGESWRELQDGYGQSKWVAEQMVIRSSQRGLPAFIYRLGERTHAHTQRTFGWCR
jgi:thioester reductase-like protein